MSFNRFDHLVVQKIASYADTKDVVNLSQTSLQNYAALSEILKVCKVINGLMLELAPRRYERRQRHGDSRMESEQYGDLFDDTFKTVRDWHNSETSLKMISMLLGNFVLRLVYADNMRSGYIGIAPESRFYLPMDGDEMRERYSPDDNVENPTVRALEYMFNIGTGVLDDPALLSLDILQRTQSPLSDPSAEPTPFLHELVGKEDKIPLLIKMGKNLKNGSNPGAPENAEAYEEERAAKRALKAKLTEIQDVCQTSQVNLDQASPQSSYALILTTKRQHIAKLLAVVTDDRQYLSDDFRLTNFKREFKKVETDLSVLPPSRFNFFWRGVDLLNAYFGDPVSTMGVDGAATVRKLNKLIG